MIPLLLLVYALANLGNTSCMKINSGLLNGASRAKYSLYLSVVGVIACVFFWIFGGFSIGVNLPTLAFALVYALIAAASIILKMTAFGLASVSGVNIIMSGCNLICSLALGALIFSEDITPIKIVRVALMLASIVFTFLEAKRLDAAKEKAEERAKGKKGIKLFIVLALIILVSCIDIVTLKLFTRNTRVLDENSFFFWTNVLLVAGCLLIVLFDVIKKKGADKEIFVLFKPKNLATTAGVTVSSNVGSLTSLALLALMDVSVYTPVTAALGVVSGVVASLIFREKLGVFSYISALLALVAVII